MIETQKVEFPVNGELFSNYETAKVEVLKCEYQIESFLSNVVTIFVDTTKRIFPELWEDYPTGFFLIPRLEELNLHHLEKTIPIHYSTSDSEFSEVFYVDTDMFYGTLPEIRKKLIPFIEKVRQDNLVKRSHENLLKESEEYLKYLELREKYTYSESYSIWS